MANTLLEIKLIGNEVCDKPKTYGLPCNFSKLDFFSIKDNILDNELSKKWSRSLTKDGKIALTLLQQIEASNLVNAKSGKLGLYGAFINGPIYYPEFSKLAHLESSNNFNEARKLWPPKQHFRQNSPLKLAHLSFVFRNMGPLYCFTDPFYSFIDARQAAELDLSLGVVDQAIVVSGFSFEDPIQIELYHQSGTKKFFEAGIAILLDKSKNLSDFSDDKKVAMNFNYGTCSPFFNNRQN